MRLTRFVLFLLVFAGPGIAYGLDGRIKDGVYTSPGRLFQVEVPVMRNPFVKKPSLIRDGRKPDGVEEVTFSVPDLGEAWRYGVIPITTESRAHPALLAEISDQQLIIWLPTPSKPHVILEEEIQLEDGPGSLRIYHQESASLLFKKNNSTAERESAIIGVVAAVSENKKQVLYMVGQFDMPMSQLRFFIEEVKMPRDRVIKRFADEHAKRLRELVKSFKLQ